MKTQEQMYWGANHQIAARDRAVMELIHCKENPLTKEDLHRAADCWPDRWEKYRHLLD